ncbi:MAG: SDR family NAD(P)-dependent oxidoreductase [Burkholderiales bacterium]|jgi:NAD(P)-dependent dehydrogenase (short-subunit alcohol dehydrogenase family)
MDGERRIALVTGAAKGIGEAIAAQLGRDGFHVVVSDLAADEAEATAARLRADGLQASALALDVGDAGSVAAAFDRLAAEHGRCDVLVNNAGIAKTFPFLDFPLENFEATMRVNVTGVLMCSQRAARMMVARRWGRIVNLASVAGMRAVGTGRTAYGTSKAAVIGLTRQMAVELAEHGVTANAIAPGPVDTPMTKVLHSAAFRGAYTAAIPSGRYGLPEEIAAVASFLASEGAAYVTGATLPVDGGFMASGARG